MNTIVFTCCVNQVKTLADHGIRITLDLPEDAIATAAQLMACKVAGIFLHIEATAAEKPEKQTENRSARREIQAGTNGQSEWATKER